MKNVVRFVVLGSVLLVLSGCLSSKSYVDPKYKDVGFDDISKVKKEHNVTLEVEFQRNGKHLPKVDKQLRSAVEKTLKETGVINPSDGSNNIRIKVICNNIADMSEAAKKGFGTGLTFGLAGSAVSDFYKVTIEYEEAGKVARKTYDHAIHTTIGNKEAPIKGVEPTSVNEAFNNVVEDVILQFIKDMQSSRKLIFYKATDHAAIS